MASSPVLTRVTHSATGQHVRIRKCTSHVHRQSMAQKSTSQTQPPRKHLLSPVLFLSPETSRTTPHTPSMFSRPRGIPASAIPPSLASPPASASSWASRLGWAVGEARHHHRLILFQWRRLGPGRVRPGHRRAVLTGGHLCGSVYAQASEAVLIVRSFAVQRAGGDKHSKHRRSKPVSNPGTVCKTGLH